MYKFYAYNIPIFNWYSVNYLPQQHFLSIFYPTYKFAV